MDPIGIAITVILFLIGVPIAYLVGRRNRQVPDLRTAVDFEVVLAPGEWLTRGDLEITFDGVSLNRVSRTYLAFWNQRGDTVRGTDVLKTDPLTIAVSPDDEILQTRVVSQSRPQVGVKVGPEKQDASLTFDFLDRKDGFIVEVTHRGEVAARFQGTVPGAAIRKAGRLTLDRRTRHLIREPWPRRLWELILTKGWRSAALAWLVVGFFFIAIHDSVAIFARALKPALVALQAFDLATLQGQRDFAMQVTKVGLPDSWAPPEAGLLIALIAGAILLIIRILAPYIPRRIASNDSDPFVPLKSERPERKV